MKSRFSSKCVSCGEPIKQGKEIAKDSSGRWVHNFCSDMSDSLDLP